jgi:hypothetical protein
VVLRRGTEARDPAQQEDFAPMAEVVEEERSSLALIRRVRVGVTRGSNQHTKKTHKVKIFAEPVACGS